MNQEEAQRWFEIGGRIVVLNVPPGTQVGVDMNSWTVGERFRGVKFLPKHLHFVHWAPVGKEGRGQGPRTGMFLWMSPAETVVLRWDAQTEDVERSQDVDEIQRCRDDHRGLDPFLGPYPHGGELARWVSLSGHITESLWRRLEPTDGKINPSDDQALRFTPFPSPCYPPGATPAEITRHSLDHSYSLGIMLQSMTDAMEILGELEYAYLCFLLGHSLTAFEQWKRLVRLLCFSERALQLHRDLFVDFVDVLSHQIREVPADFFVDLVEPGNNFLVQALQRFFSSVDDLRNDRESRELVWRAHGLRTHLCDTCEWAFFEEGEGDDDDGPLVVGPTDGKM